MINKVAYFVCLLGVVALLGSSCTKKKRCAAYGKQYVEQVEMVKEELQ
jgi:hypothetical protein